ncbi:MAG: DUF3747 domain-containing protein [Cyanobacteriota bacterium]
MKRPYLALATFALVAGVTQAQIPHAWASGLFSSAPVQATSFAVLARPVGDGDWTLVVLEQLQPRPFCWTPRPDGLVDPSLNRFDYTGVCGRFIDSNGYSLRIGDVDLNHAYRLRVQQTGSELQLLATTATRGAELVVGRGLVPRRDRDLFVSLQLEPGWELQRRMFGDRSLNHVYFANSQPLDSLIATVRGGTSEVVPPQGNGLLAPPAAPPPLKTSPGELSRQIRGGRQAPSPRGPATTTPEATPDAPETTIIPAGRESASEGTASGVVALQVIPYEERSGGEGQPRPSNDRFSSAQGQ